MAEEAEPAESMSGTGSGQPQQLLHLQWHQAPGDPVRKGWSRGVCISYQPPPRHGAAGGRPSECAVGSVVAEWGQKPTGPGPLAPPLTYDGRQTGHFQLTTHPSSGNKLAHT